MFALCLFGIYFLYLREKYLFLFTPKINKIKKNWDFISSRGKVSIILFMTVNLFIKALQQ